MNFLSFSASGAGRFYLLVQVRMAEAQLDGTSHSPRGAGTHLLTTEQFLATEPSTCLPLHVQWILETVGNGRINPTRQKFGFSFYSVPSFRTTIPRELVSFLFLLSCIVCPWSYARGQEWQSQEDWHHPYLVASSPPAANMGSLDL